MGVSYESVGTLTLTGATVKRLKRPLVYVWRRGAQVLYVGSGQTGMCRPLGPHHKMGQFEDSDSLTIHFFDSKTAALAEEARLIRQLEPVLNGPGKPAVMGSINHRGAILDAVEQRLISVRNEIALIEKIIDDDDAAQASRDERDWLEDGETLESLT